MDYLVYLLLVLSITWAYFHIFTSDTSGGRSLPPGPRRFPIIGNIFELGDNPHQLLAKLSKIYGPIMSLKLGSRTTIVISSPDLAKEALNKHDEALSSRTIPNSIHVYNHPKNSIFWLPTTSAHWRFLRKVSTTQMFTLQKLDASQELRQKKVEQLLDYVQENCKSGKAIDIGQVAFTTVLNLISNTLFSIDLAGYNTDMSQEFNNIVVDLLEQVGKPNLADYFPILGLVDPQGARQRVKVYFERIVKIFDGITMERMQLLSDSSKTSERSHDVLDSLLLIVKEGNSEFSFADIKHFLLDFFIASTDTMSRTLEWAMAELLHNPEKLAKAKTELKEVEEVVLESDISKFPYLQATIKESLRLHPPAPFLVPHKAECEVEICGFKVPKNAEILVNVWAIGRDESIWPNPYKFEPERFLDNKIDVKGRDFELLPFGSGRRICPGLPLAHRMVHLMLASLVHKFDWKLVNELNANDMDMSETFGLTIHKTQPLLAIPYN